MRTYDPADEDDRQSADDLKAEPWMLDLLKCNPDYVHWGPHEDYMWKPGDEESEKTNPRKKDHGWESRVLKDGWQDFGPWELDDMNEAVHFYFEIARESKDCPTCGGNGYHPDAQWVSESFYSHSSPFKHPTLRERMASDVMARFSDREHSPLHGYSGFPSDDTLAKYGPAFIAFCEDMRAHGCWDERVTQDEVDALVEGGRLSTYDNEQKRWVDSVPHPTAEEVNACQAGRLIPEGGKRFSSHDAINRSILVEARLKRLGVPCHCPECDGSGHVYTADHPHVNLVLWMLHPRKGASRGVEVKNVRRSDLPAVSAWLEAAAKRNADRFSRLSSMPS